LGNRSNIRVVVGWNILNFSIDLKKNEDLLPRERTAIFTFSSSYTSKRCYVILLAQDCVTDIAGIDGYFAHMSPAKDSAEPGG
jgi:hypothetical protein